MKAVVITRPGGPEVLEYREVPDPVAGPEDLLIRVRATALNRADLLQRMGGYPQPGPKPAFEIPGLEYAGEVVAVGERVEGFALGDRVMGLLAGGGYAELVATHYRLAVKVPDVLSWEEAGATPEVFITAHDALLQCGLVAGERVLIHAAGSGVGVAAIQVAKVMGASLVAGTAGSAEKLARAAELGLDLGINYREQDVLQEVRRATGRRGVDVVLDHVGAATWETSIKALAPGGRLTVCGATSGPQTQVDIRYIYARQLTIVGTWVGTQAEMREVLRLIQRRRFVPVVYTVLPLEEAAEAHRIVEESRHFGKVVLQVT